MSWLVALAAIRLGRTWAKRAFRRAERQGKSTGFFWQDSMRTEALPRLMLPDPLMPKGVEHFDKPSRAARQIAVPDPLMPKGVEHPLAASRSAMACWFPIR